MIAFKPGVNISNVHPAVWIAIGIAACIRDACYATTPMTITALNAGTSGHMQGSYHYPAATPSKMCQAVDLRNSDLSASDRLDWFNLLTAVLHPMGYDLVNETVTDPNSTANHIHIEFQPKVASQNYLPMKA